MATAPGTAVGMRLQWIDAARGACVVAVILFHVCSWQFLPLDRALWQPGREAWIEVDRYLGSVRMPMLLAISGMLAARRISEGWSRPGAAVRVASSYYLYVVWLVLYLASDRVFSSVDLYRIGSIGDFLTQLFVPETPLWFIFALALYVVVLTSVRRVPPWFVLGALAALSVAVLSTEPGPTWWRVPENTVFFAAGVYGGRLLQALAARRRITDLLIATVVALGSVVLAKWRIGPVGDSLEHMFHGIVCIVLAAAFVPHLVRWRPLAAAGNYVGRRTLQIYLLHPPLILLVLVLLNHAGTDWLGGALRNPLVTALWPIVLTLVIIVLAVLIHRVLERIGLGVLFDPPSGYTGGIVRVHGWLGATRHLEATGRDIESAQAVQPLRLPKGRLLRSISD